MEPPPSTVDSDDSLLDPSTAATTPAQSLTFSPVLHPSKFHDSLDEGSTPPITPASLNAARDAPAFRVRNICCVGAGYVGGPTAAVMAFQNPHLAITVVDRDAKRIQQWQSRHLPLYEPGLHPILRVARDGARAFSFLNETAPADPLDNISSASSDASSCESQCAEHREEIAVPGRAPNLFFSTEVSRCISEADIVLIAINTPTKARGVGAGRATDMTALEAVTREVALHAKDGAILVEKSTVPCRTADLIAETVRIHRPNLNFEVLSNPEFLAAGTAITNLLHPDRVIIGSESTPSGLRAAAALADVYAAWVPRAKIVTTNLWSSELSKLVANSMLAQRISSINSISAICEKVGADIDDVSKSVGLDERIGRKYLKAGIGFGGSCFKKDILSLVYLAQSLGLEEVADYWTQVLDINEWQRVRFARRVIRCLNGTLSMKKLTVLGYAFKEDTSDTRESPALETIRLLLEDGPSEIAVYDPFCDPAFIRAELKQSLGASVLREAGGPIEVYPDAYPACANSHAIIITTDCDMFRNAPSPATSSAPRREAQNQDPRPFQHLSPTESELLRLQAHLSSSLGAADPLERFTDEPACAEGCEACRTGTQKSEAQIARRAERLDWSRIAYHLEKPKWVFDGRGVLKVPDMEALGVRVEGIGRVGWAGR